MTDLKWFDEYSGQSTDELIALEGEYRTDSLVLAFEQAIDRKAARTGLEGLSEEERIILAVEALEREVNNGGYHQFFVNSKEFAPIIVRALNRIGCSEAASLTQDAISALDLRGPVSIEAIDQTIYEENDERDTELDACSNTYYRVVGDLSRPLLEFIKANRNMIRLPVE